MVVYPRPLSPGGNMEILLVIGITILVTIIVYLARVNRDLWNLVDDLDN